MNRENSFKLFQKAKLNIPGGVNSPARAFNAVDTFPAFITEAKGSKITDCDGNRFIDYVCSWGTNIVGHANEEVLEALQEAAKKGLSFGATTEAEIELADLILSALPGMEQLRLVSSGTEACMTALRLARGYTQKSKIIKFQGNYHGHSDSLLVEAGSGVATLGIPASKGVTKESVQNTLVAVYNDINSVKELIENNPREVAAIILEPIVGNSGYITPHSRFLSELRQLCDQEGIILIFDEVMTGFRVAWGGAQVTFKITPDLSTFGKVIGGGLPIGAIAGKKSIMEQLSPVGDVYQAGTLSGNPVAVACGIKTLDIMKRPNSYEKLSSYQEKLTQGIRKAAKKYDLPVQSNGQGGLFGMSFSSKPVQNYQEATACDERSFLTFFREVFHNGLYWPPSRFEACFNCLEHDENDLEMSLEIIKKAFSKLLLKG